MKIGVDVPWNAAWSGENRFEIRPCRWSEGRRALWQPHAPGSGRPIFAEPHMVRQRMSIARLLCTVCGVHTPAGDRLWFRLGDKRGDSFITTEAPVHLKCAALALEACPHLKRRGEAPTPFPDGYRIVAAMVGGEATERDFRVKLRRDETIVGHLKFAWRAMPADVDSGFTILRRSGA